MDRLTSTDAAYVLHTKCKSVMFQSTNSSNTLKIKAGGNNVLTLYAGIPYAFSDENLAGHTVSVTIAGGAVEILMILREHV